MFKLIKDAGDYAVHVSEFKRRYNLSPFTLVSGLGPSKYPCLVGFLKAFEETPTETLRIDGTVRIIYKETIINEIYYRSQAKKLVYPSEGQLTRPKSTKIISIAGLDRFITTFWHNYHRHYERDQINGGYTLQNHQVNELRTNVYAGALPCIVSVKNVNMANSLIYVTIFPVLTVEEAKSLVYYRKNTGLKQRRIAAKGGVIRKAEEKLILDGQAAFERQPELSYDHNRIYYDDTCGIYRDSIDNIPF